MRKKKIIISKNKGQILWNKAKKIIPGGNMLISKRPERFLPNRWPAYFKKTKGCYIWDLDSNKYVDLSLMGVGTNILGYSNNEVDSAVKNVVKDGNLSTLNCPEEVKLAEKLISIHPWAKMVKFTRSGGEANALAIRIARAATGKDKILVCGYHGWHDWYIASNLENNKNLDQLLLPGIKTLGVPKKLKGTTLTFNYNDLARVTKLLKSHKDIGAIKMEVERNLKPKKNFLKQIRKLCNKYNILLIFDECTSGFRETNGGLHLKYKVNPDIAIFGKALGNGYAINAIIGTSKVMRYANKTFISSTFWTERIGPTAALKTLEIMRREKTWKKIKKIGSSIKFRWLKLSEKHKIPIEIFGLDALCGFNFKSKKNLHFKTFITQEMLKKGFLASNIIYVCIKHNEKILEKYFKILDKIFLKIKINFKGNKINNLLEEKISEKSFGRLN